MKYQMIRYCYCISQEIVTNTSDTFKTNNFNLLENTLKYNYVSLSFNIFL